MDFKQFIESLKEKSTTAVELGKLRVKKMNLERKISKFHCRLGERVNYLFKIGKNVEDDEIVKGFISEIKTLESEIEEIEKKMEELRRKEEEAAQLEAGNVSSSDTDHSGQNS